MTPPTDNYKAMLARAPSAPGAGCSARSIATSSVRAWAPAFSRGCPSDDVHEVTTCRAATAADAHAHSAHSAHSRRARTAGERRPRCEATAPQPLGARLSISKWAATAARGASGDANPRGAIPSTATRVGSPVTDGYGNGCCLQSKHATTKQLEHVHIGRS